MKHCIFPKPTEKWKAYVWEHRNKNFEDEYDWVFGPVADRGFDTENPLDVKSLPDLDQLAVKTDLALNNFKAMEVITR